MSSKKQRAIFCSECNKLTRQTCLGKSKRKIQEDVALGVGTLGLWWLISGATGDLGGPTHWECSLCGHINED